jgi:hypothetical protein
MSLDLTTRRTFKITLTANTVYDFNLGNVYFGKNIVIPNIVQVRNLNTTDIVYFDYTNAVSTTYYVQSISPLTNRKHVTSNTATRLYFLTASNCDIEITTAYDPEPNVSDLDDTKETSIINNTLTVGNVGVSSIAAGTNNIGKVDIEHKIPAGDNTIGKVGIDGAIPAGDNNIGNVDLASAIPAGDNNIGNVDLASAIPAGTNTIGNVKITDGTETLAINEDGSINVNMEGTTINATIDNVGIKDASDHALDINADGSINVKNTASLPAGDNNIGNVDLASAIPAGDNNIGNVDLASSIPAGTNNIGDVDVLTVGAGQNIKPATTINIYNVNCATAYTEYSQALPANTKSFTIGVKSKNESVDWSFAFETSATATFDLLGNESFSQENLLLANSTLYFTTDTDDEDIQIIAFS